MTGPRGPTGVGSFLASLPSDRRQDFERVREVILKHLPRGYEEAVSGKMLVYQVPLTEYADTYNGQPLWYVALASQKNHMSLHLMRIYGDPAQARLLDESARKAGKVLQMGKACIRFRAADDLPLDTVGEIVASTPLKRWVAIAKAAAQR